MKYSENNKPIVCLMTQSTCYKKTSIMKPKGVLWHSTGANNPTLKRCVQPDDDAPNREELIALIGKNIYGNDWNHMEVQAGLNAWIGKLADGTVTTIQTMPWNYKPWGCGSGINGSCNNGWMQFEICEDSLEDEEYFNAVYQEGCELTAYYCKLYNLNPKGVVSYNGVAVPVILDHATSQQLGLGSNHGDVQHWFSKYGKTLDDVREDVAKLLEKEEVAVEKSENTSNPLIIKEGDLISLTADAVYYNGKAIPDWVKNQKWYVYDINEDYAIINKSEDGKSSIMSAVAIEFLIKVNDEIDTTEKNSAEAPAITEFPKVNPEGSQEIINKENKEQKQSDDEQKYTETANIGSSLKDLIFALIKFIISLFKKS